MKNVHVEAHSLHFDALKVEVTNLTALFFQFPTKKKRHFHQDEVGYPDLF